MVNFFIERTVRWKNSRVILIDQSKLPNKFSYIKCTDYRQVADCIKNMKIRGAPALGVAAAMGLALCAYSSKSMTKQDLLLELNKAGEVLIDTRPTAANLAWGVKRICKKASESIANIKSLKKIVINEAIKMGDEDVAINRRIGENGSILLSDFDRVLTHCK